MHTKAGRNPCRYEALPSAGVRVGRVVCLNKASLNSRRASSTSSDSTAPRIISCSRTCVKGGSKTHQDLPSDLVVPEKDPTGWYECQAYPTPFLPRQSVAHPFRKPFPSRLLSFIPSPDLMRCMALRPGHTQACVSGQTETITLPESHCPVVLEPPSRFTGDRRGIHGRLTLSSQARLGPLDPAGPRGGSLVCPCCGGGMRRIACIEHAEGIEKILAPPWLGATPV